MKIVTLIKAYFKSKKTPNTFRAAYEIYRNYGRAGFWKAVDNRKEGFLALEGLDNNNSQEQVPLAYSAPTTSSTMTDHDEIGRRILQEQQQEYSGNEYCKLVSSLTYVPLISVIMPLFNPPITWLLRSIESLKGQYYENWELCVVDDGSQDRRGISLIKKLAKDDKRIRFAECKQNGGISVASNMAIEMSKGSYLALMDQDDAIPPDALYWVALEINKDQDADFIYSDECKVDTGERPHYSTFFFKPDWSPEFMISYMYTGHLSVYKKALAQQIGGFRTEFDFSQDYDFALRASDVAQKIVHIERVLYFWRTLKTSGASGGKSFSNISNLSVLTDYFERKGYCVMVGKNDGARFIFHQRQEIPKVSIVVPTDNLNHINTLIYALTKDTGYMNYEIIFVVNSKIAKTLEEEYPYYKHLIIICRYDEVFNFSDKCNEGAKKASGDILVFLNDDAYPAQRDWIERLLDVLEIPGVGGVSPAMLYNDGDRVQYAGMQMGHHICGLSGPSFHLKSFRDGEGRVITARQIRNTSVLSGACMMIKKDVFAAIGGFDAHNTPNGHSDVDISFRISLMGLRCVYVPSSTMVHAGFGTWTTLGMRDKANLYLLKRWHEKVKKDPYFTLSMRRYLREEEKLDFELFVPDDYHPEACAKGDILLLSHEFSHTGAPVVLLAAAKVLNQHGYYVVVASPERGPIMQDFLQAGIVVIIDKTYANYKWHQPQSVPASLSTSVSGFVNDFDLVICSTMVCHNFVNCYNNTKLPIIWWLHEGWVSYQGNANRNDISKGMTIYLPEKLGQNVKVYCGGLYALEMLKKYNLDYNADVLLYGVKDIATQCIQKKTDKVVFLLPASYEERKNQALLFEALALIPKEIATKAEFWLIGNILNKKVYNSIKELAIPYSNVKVCEPVTYDELMEIYTEVSCIMITSIDDPMPVVLAEGMMLSKIVLCSNMAGTSRYITDGKNGFVFDCTNAAELAKKIEFIIENEKHMNTLRAVARDTYEQVFAMNIFEKNLLQAVEKNIVRFSI